MYPLNVFKSESMLIEKIKNDKDTGKIWECILVLRKTCSRVKKKNKLEMKKKINKQKFISEKNLTIRSRCI